MNGARLDDGTNSPNLIGNCEVVSRGRMISFPTVGVGGRMGAGITKIFGVHDKFSENGGGLCRFMLKPAISFLGAHGVIYAFSQKVM